MSIKLSVFMRAVRVLKSAESVQGDLTYVRAMHAHDCAQNFNRLIDKRILLLMRTGLSQSHRRKIARERGL